MEDFTEDYLITDGALYLVESASGYTALFGQVDEQGKGRFVIANESFVDEVSFDDVPDRILLIAMPE